MKLKTRVFEFCNGKYRNLPELAQVMGIALSQVYRVRQGKRNINHEFIIGAVKAFPEYTLDELFYVAPNMSQDERRLGMSREGARQIVTGSPAPQKPDMRSMVMLTPREVAYLLNVHINTVRRWNNKGILKSYRISSRGDRRFRREDVDELLKEGKRN